MKKISRCLFKLYRIIIILTETFILSWFVDIILRIHFCNLTEMIYNCGIELRLSPSGEFPDEAWWVTCYPYCLFLVVLGLILLVKKI